MDEPSNITGNYSDDFQFTCNVRRGHPFWVIDGQVYEAEEEQNYRLTKEGIQFYRGRSSTYDYIILALLIHAILERNLTKVICGAEDLNQNNVYVYSQPTYLIINGMRLLQETQGLQ